MPDYDTIIIGGGPAGATAGLVLAREGFRVLIVERTAFPRFHIGESLLPRHFTLLKELGLLEQVRRLPHVPKFGVAFTMGDSSATARFPFSLGLIPGYEEALNLERAPFDALLLRNAKDAGATVMENATVKRVVRL